jgi:hypothetical protein
MRRHNLSWAVAIATGCLLAFALPATADAAPKFGKTYTGSVSGTISDYNSASGQRTEIDWQVTGLRFKLHKKVGTLIKNALYTVTAGSATINAVETGYCTFSSHSTVSFPDALVGTKVSYPLVLTYTPLYKTTGWTGSLVLKNSIMASETCDYGDGYPQGPTDRPLQLPQLLNMGYASHKKLNPIKGSYKTNDQHGNGSSTTRTVWNWNLKAK